jgi:hypothetical protein
MRLSDVGQHPLILLPSKSLPERTGRLFVTNECLPSIVACGTGRLGPINQLVGRACVCVRSFSFSSSRSRRPLLLPFPCPIPLCLLHFLFLTSLFAREERLFFLPALPPRFLLFALRMEFMVDRAYG